MEPILRVKLPFDDDSNNIIISYMKDYPFFFREKKMLIDNFLRPKFIDISLYPGSTIFCTGFFMRMDEVYRIENDTALFVRKIGERERYNFRRSIEHIDEEKVIYYVSRTAKASILNYFIHYFRGNEYVMNGLFNKFDPSYWISEDYRLLKIDSEHGECKQFADLKIEGKIIRKIDFCNSENFYVEYHEDGLDTLTIFYHVSGKETALFTRKFFRPHMDYQGQIFDLGLKDILNLNTGELIDNVSSMNGSVILPYGSEILTFNPYYKEYKDLSLESDDPIISMALQISKEELMARFQKDYGELFPSWKIFHDGQEYRLEGDRYVNLYNEKKVLIGDPAGMYEYVNSQDQEEGVEYPSLSDPKLVYRNYLYRAKIYEVDTELLAKNIYKINFSKIYFDADTYFRMYVPGVLPEGMSTKPIDVEEKDPSVVEMPW